MSKHKELKIYGFAMILLGLVDVGFLTLDICEVNALAGNYPAVVVFFTYIFFALCALLALAKFWMGRQALCYAKGTGKGTSHVLLAKIGFVLSILVVASDAYAMISGTATSSELYSGIASLIFMYSYYKAAKACL